MEISMNNKTVKTISGRVHYLARMGLPPDSILEVSLLDVSLADAPARVLDVQVTPNARDAGLHFNLTYDLADVFSNHTYAISARITHNDQLIFYTTTQHQVVLGVDHLQGQEVLVDPV